VRNVVQLQEISENCRKHPITGKELVSVNTTHLSQNRNLIFILGQRCGNVDVRTMIHPKKTLGKSEPFLLFSRALDWSFCEDTVSKELACYSSGGDDWLMRRFNYV